MTQLPVTILGFGMMGRARAVAYENITRYFKDSPYQPTLCQAFVLPNEADAAAKVGWVPETDMRKAIFNEQTDYIDICLPNAMHYAAVLSAIEAGKHVFCEKPLAVSIQEGREMVAAAKARPELLNSVHFTYRRVPANIYARKLVADNRFGKLLESHSYYNQHWGGPGVGFGWRFDRAAGGGTVGDLGSHAIDMLYFVTGKRPERLCALQYAHVKERSGRKIEVDDASYVMFYLPDGAIGTLSCTRNAHGSENSQGYELYFEHGAIRWRYDDLDYLEIYDANDPQRGWTRVLCSAAGYAYDNQAEAPLVGYRDLLLFGCYENMRAIAKMEPIAPIATFQDAYEVDRTIEAIRLSAENQTWINLDEIPQ
ncbi:MAG: Gfo/Idh/MocA family oxidoreductase [Planctomycetia bacterium]|nr:Gfo/Idh/MocA family oxidoreductase [Planctomycetia bacterium]